MEDFLNSEIALTIASFLAGALATGIAWGASALAASFRASSNKIDDALIPLLDSVAKLTEAVNKKDKA